MKPSLAFVLVPNIFAAVLMLSGMESCRGAALPGPAGPDVEAAGISGSALPGGAGGLSGGITRGVPAAASGGGTTGPAGRLPEAPGTTTGTAGLKNGEVPHPVGLTEFTAEFMHLGGMGPSIPGRGSVMIPLPPVYRHAGFRLSLRKTGEAYSYEVSSLASGRGLGSPGVLASGPATPEDAQELCGVLNMHDTARLDGWHRSNSALGCDFMLRVRYAGGEKIDASGRGGASVLPPACWAPEAYLNFFSRLAESQGMGFRTVRPTAEGTGPLRLLVVRFTLAESRSGMPAGRHDYQLFKGSGGYEYSLAYSRSGGDYARISGAASQEDMAAAKAMLSSQGCWMLAGAGRSSGHFGGGDSYGFSAAFESGPALESGGENGSIPAAWHEEPWFEFFMKLAESHGERELKARLFGQAAE